jgi:hypothetical protein
MAGARFRVANLHAAPTASSRVVAVIFEERRLADQNGLHFEWTIELTANPSVPLPWPEGDMAFDYGLHVAGVQRRGDWVRLLTSIPVDGWLRTNDINAPGDHPLYVYVHPLEDEIVNLGPLSAEWPDRRREQTQEGSFRILRVANDTVEFRQEIPSDYPCGEQVTDPAPLPPTLRARTSEFFNSDGTPRFAEKYTKGC